jgi:hypothetical protein
VPFQAVRPVSSTYKVPLHTSAEEIITKTFWIDCVIDQTYDSMLDTQMPKCFNPVTATTTRIGAVCNM